MEIDRAEDARLEVQDKTGFSGRNVGMALLFWPGIIVNEVQGGKAEDAAQDRVERLNGLYYQQGCGGTGAAS